VGAGAPSGIYPRRPRAERETHPALRPARLCAPVHARELPPRIIGVETVDHPTDGQLAASVRRYFDDIDRAR
jgi:hypothetical protein